MSFLQRSSAAPASWFDSDGLAMRDAANPALAHPYPGLRYGEWDVSDAANGAHTPAEPQYFMPPQSGVAANGLPIFNWNQAAAQIARQSNGWGDVGITSVVSYGFRASAPASMPSGTTNFSQFSAAQITATVEILNLWSEVANVAFNRVGAGYTNSATMLFGNYNTDSQESAFAFYPGSTAASASAGDVWVNLFFEDNLELSEGDYGTHILAHEIGHAIGLAHPGDYDASDPDEPGYPADADYWQDARMFTVMSYFGSSGTGGSLNAFASGPQLHDIAAAQLLYGANMSTRTGNTTYGFNSNTGHAHFTINADGDSPVFAIWDAGGIDTINFSGYSTAVEIDLREEAFSSAGPGNEGVGIAIGNISIARGAVIENGLGGSGADKLIGNAVANLLNGGAGNDGLSGFSGNDTLQGGDGNDTLTGGSGADALDGGAGVDSVSYAGSAARVIVRLWNQTAEGGDAQGDTLANIERAAGSNFNDLISGSNNVANLLSGAGGNDNLNGLSGNDTLQGGDGNDTLTGGVGADALDGGAGADTVSYAGSSSRVIVRLWNQTAEDGDAQGDTISNIERAAGSAFNDLISGSNSVANLLDGLAGNDILQGLSGNDTLQGGDGHDTLVGGVGADVLDGGAGVDAVSYTASGSRVIVRLWNQTAEGGDAQGDTLANIERAVGSAFNDLMSGANVVANTLDGQAGNDNLNGLSGADILVGGLGADTLTGGADADQFVFDAALGAGNVDTITDFNVADDVIHLSTAIFNVGSGTLAANAFVIGPAAADADDRIIYDSATGALLYDADGNGAGAAVQFATLATGLALTNDDFFGFG